MRQIRQTLLDIRFYLVFLWAFFVCITSVVTFGSIVINGFGFTPFKTLLVGLPGPAIQLVTIWVRRSLFPCLVALHLLTACPLRSVQARSTSSQTPAAGLKSPSPSCRSPESP
jgi:hypothetical protein